MLLNEQALPCMPAEYCWAGYVVAGQSLPIEGVLSDQKIKKGTFLRVEKLSFWESPFKIHGVVGTPNGFIKGPNEFL